MGRDKVECCRRTYARSQNYALVFYIMIIYFVIAAYGLQKVMNVACKCNIANMKAVHF